jgi:hypothetical protein
VTVKHENYFFKKDLQGICPRFIFYVKGNTYQFSRRIHMKDSALNQDDFDEILMATAQSALGAIYYNTKLTRKQTKDGLWQMHIAVYEKYRRPNQRAAALLKKYGVKATLHRAKRD